MTSQFHLSQLCPIHQEPLEQKRVLIMSGMHRYTPAWHQLQRERFPYSNSVVSGGCFPNSEGDIEVLVCRSCRAAEICIWLEDRSNCLSIPGFHVEVLKRRSEKLAKHNETG